MGKREFKDGLWVGVVGKMKLENKNENKGKIERCKMDRYLKRAASLRRVARLETLLFLK
jgi:hypothetical protein